MGFNPPMIVRIGDIDIAKNNKIEYTLTKYAEGSIGIRGRVPQESDISSIEDELYRLREGRTQEIEIDYGGSKITGEYKINELNWKKERKGDGSYELQFIIGLQRGQFH